MKIICFKKKNLNSSKNLGVLTRRIWDERPWVNALFPRSRSMEKFRRNLLNQGKYTIEILKRFNMLECKSMATPMDSIAAATVFPFFLNFGPSFYFILPNFVWIHDFYLFSHCCKLDCFEDNCFRAFRKIAYVWNCLMFPIWLVIYFFDIRSLFHCFHCCFGGETSFSSLTSRRSVGT